MTVVSLYIECLKAEIMPPVFQGIVVLMQFLDGISFGNDERDMKAS